MPVHAGRKKAAARPARTHQPATPAVARQPSFTQRGDATDAALDTMRDRVAQEVRIANETMRRDVGADADGIVARAAERALAALKAQDSPSRHAHSAALDVLTDRLDDTVTEAEVVKKELNETNEDLQKLRGDFTALQARVRELTANAAQSKPKTRKSTKTKEKVPEEGSTGTQAVEEKSESS